jgi:Rrf2 family protein
MAAALRVSEAAAMALHTLVFLAQDAGRPLTTREIATQLAGSEAHLSKVLQRLGKLGLVISSRGPHGGFVLGQDAETINLLRVFEAFDGPIGDVNCMQTPARCDGTTCVFGELVAIINRTVRDYLQEISLSDLRYDGTRLIKASKKGRKGREA